MLGTLAAWLYANVWGNLVASFVAWIIAATAAWFWKIRPHVRAQAAHRDHVTRQLADLHQAVSNAT